MSLAEHLLSLFAEPERVEVTDLFPPQEAKLFVQELTGAQRAEWMRQNDKEPDTADVRLVIAGLVTEDGRPVFTRAHQGALMQNGSSFITAISWKVRQVSRFFESPEPLKKTPPGSPCNGRPAPEVGPSVSWSQG